MFHGAFWKLQPDIMTSGVAGCRINLDRDRKHARLSILSYIDWTQALTAQPSRWRVNGVHNDKELP